MRPGRLHLLICLTALLPMTLLPGCEDSQTLDGSPLLDTRDEVPSGTQASMTVEPGAAPVPAEPPVEEPSRTVATIHEAAVEPPEAVDAPPEAIGAEESKPLILTIDTEPAPEKTGTGMGEMPDSDWLGNRKAAGGSGSEAGSGKLLPHLFDKKENQEPVSVRSELLIEEGSVELSRPVDGAGVVIEFKTD